MASSSFLCQTRTWCSAIMAALEVRKTGLEGVLLVQPPTIHEDFRGQFVETYNQEVYRQADIQTAFVQDDVSISHRGVLRGLHGDGETWKLVTCLYGRVYLVVVNWNPVAPQYRKWESFTLSDQNHLQVLIPPMFANGYQTLSDRAIFHSKQSTNYQPAGQFSLRWDDPALGLWWPIKNPMLSQRDGG